jgi:hypothetical protein
MFLSDSEKVFIEQNLKKLKSQREIVILFFNKYKRKISRDAVRNVAIKMGIDPKRNLKNLSKEEKLFILKHIKNNQNINKIQKIFNEEFNKIPHRQTIEKIAKDNNVEINKFDLKEYSENEVSIIKGLWILNNNISSIAKILKNRTINSISEKIKDMKIKGVLSEKVKKDIFSDIKKNINVNNLSKKYGIKISEIKNIKKNIEKQNVEFLNLKRWEEKDIDEVLDLIEDAQKKLKGLNSEQSEANIKINTNNKHIAIAFISDLHLENVNTDVSQMRKDFKIIKNTKDFYMGFGGDFLDNFSTGPFKEGANEAVISLKAARIVAGKLFDSVKTKVLWTILGCHDDWDKKYAEYNLVEHIARKLHVPYLGYGGDINLKINNVEYFIHARHKYRGSSGLNNGTACCKNILRDIDPKFQIVSVGHNHFAEIKIEHYLGKQRVFIRNGSYKVEDRFSKSLGYQSNSFNIQIPVVILNTKTNQMKIVSGIENAAEMLLALNK